MKKLFSLIIALFIMIVPIAGCQQPSSESDTASLKLDKKSVNIQVLGEAQIIADYSNLSETLTWENSDSSVITMESYDNYVKVKAIKSGFSVVTAKSGKLSATCTVVVAENSNVFSLVVDRLEDIELQKGGSIYVPATTMYGGQEIEGATINYTIADTTIASVANGVVTGLKAGETTLSIQGEFNGMKTAIRTVKVVIKDGAALVLSMSQLNLYEYDVTASQTYYPSSSNLDVYIVEDGKKVKDIDYTVDNTDDGVATINAENKISSVESGDTMFTITCEYKGQTYVGYLYVSVEKIPLLEITLNQSSATLFYNALSKNAKNSVSLVSVIRFDGRAMQGTPTYSVSSGNNVATVNADGTVKAIAPGKAVVSAAFKHNGKTVRATCDVTVKSDLYYGGVVSDTLEVSAENAIFAYLSGDYNTIKIDNVDLTTSHDADLVRFMTLTYDGVTPNIYRLFIRATDVNNPNNWIEGIYSHHNSGHSLDKHGTNGLNLYAVNTSSWTLLNNVVGITNYRPAKNGNNVTVLKAANGYSACSGTPSEWLNLRLRDPQTKLDYTKYMIGFSVVNDEASINYLDGSTRKNLKIFNKDAQADVLVNHETYANPVWSGFTANNVSKVNVTIRVQLNDSTKLSAIMIDTLGGAPLTSSVMNNISLIQA